MRSHVPEDVIQQILSNLPVKTLLRFISVCSSWQSLIKNPSFVSNNLTRTHCQEQQLLLLGCWVDNDHGTYKEWQYSLHEDNEEFKEYRKLINLPFKTIPTWESSKTVGCCNGLVCLKKIDKDSYRLWNPTLGKLYTVPKSNLPDKFDAIVDATEHGDKYGAYTRILEGFGFDSITNDYKLLRIVLVYGKEKNDYGSYYSFFVGGWIDIYSYKADSWKDITPADDILFTIDSGYVCEHQIPFAKGFLYFLGYESTRGLIAWRFDVASEVLREIILSQKFPRRLQFIGYGDSSIAIFERCWIEGFYIWLMDENCDAESCSWTKVFVTVEVEANEEEQAIKLHSMPLLVRKNGEPIIEKIFPGIVSYNPHRKQCYVFSEKGYDASVNYYVESLALLDIENEVTNAEFESAFVNVDEDSMN